MGTKLLTSVCEVGGLHNGRGIGLVLAPKVAFKIRRLPAVFEHSVPCF